MISITPTASILPDLKEALRRRLADLPPGSASVPEAGGHNAEEALRKLMVPLRTRLRGRAFAASDQAEFTCALAAIAAKAGWDDVRFLDGFNVIHESWDPAYLPDMRREFLALYRTVIERALA